MNPLLEPHVSPTPFKLEDEASVSQKMDVLFLKITKETSANSQIPAVCLRSSEEQDHAFTTNPFLHFWVT